MRLGIRSFDVWRIVLCAGLAGAMAGAAYGAAPPTDTSMPALDAQTALQTSQAVIGKQIGDYILLDREGRRVSLSSYRGKPLVVSFIYTGCFQICPTGTRSLQESVNSLQKIVGEGQFNVISVGFNQPADSPQAMRAFALQHRVSAPNWDFLSAPAPIVASLTKDFGFSYVATPAGFDHLLAATVLDAQGQIYSQVYGERLTADKLGEPLRQLLRGAPIPQGMNLSDLLERVRVLCSVYDAETGTYRYDYGLILEILGGITFAVAMIWFGLAEWRQSRRSRPRKRVVARPTVAPSRR